MSRSGLGVRYADPAALFASTADTYAAYRRGHPSQFTDQIHAAAPAGPILDLGCGPGTVAIPLATWNRRIIAMDANPDMLAAGRAAAEQAGVGPRIEWRLGDVHDLSGVPTVAAVVVADAFHWFDRPAVLAQLARRVRPGGFVAVLMSYAAGTAKPWWCDTADQVIARYLGPGRLAGAANPYLDQPGGDHETVLRASAFSDITVIRTDQRVTADLDAVMGAQYTQAYSSPAVLGEHLPAFDADLRRLLTAAEPSGVFTATVHPAMIIARRMEDQ